MERTISWFQITKYRVINFISVCLINIQEKEHSCYWLQLYLSDRRKGQMSGTGGVAGRSFASAMMCSKVMSVCVQTSTTHTSWGVPLSLCPQAAAALVGVLRRTWTTMGSRLMASTTASSWSTLEKSRAFTWGKSGPKSGTCHVGRYCEKTLRYSAWNTINSKD